MIAKSSLKLSFILLFGSIFTGISLANVLQIRPVFSDERFSPSDQFHATCTSNLDIVVDAKENDISAAFVLLNFNPDELEIVRVMGHENSSKQNISINPNQIQYFNPSLNIKKGNKNNVFTIVFRSNPGILSSDIIVQESSYLLDQNDTNTKISQTKTLYFADVPECDPDIIPPSISLLRPSEDSRLGIELDSIFVFEVKDLGKGVDFSSLKLEFNDKVYDLESQYLSQSGDLIFFQPETRLPVSSNILIKLSVSDLQRYGGANTTEKTFTFKTAGEILLQSNINPMELKMQSFNFENMKGSMQECVLLKILKDNLQTQYSDMIKSTMNRINCHLELGDIQISENNYRGFHAAALAQNKEKESISVFALTGWFLLFLFLIISLYNYLSTSSINKKS